MTETPTPREKTPLWQIIVEVVISAIALPATFFALILVPVAFALPIIIGRPKMLYIPVCIMPLLLAIFFILNGAELILFFMLCIGVAILGAFGVGAGFLIRRFRKSRTWVKVFAIIIGGVILFAPFLFVVEGFTGMIRSPFVNRRVRAYVAEHYVDFDLTVGCTGFSLKDGIFGTRIYDRNNPDISFRINVHNGVINDTFRSGTFWEGTLNHMLTPLLEEKFGDEFLRFTSGIRGVRIAQQFDLDANVEKTARIAVATENADPETLATQLSRYHEFFLQNGFIFLRYTFHFHYENAPPIRGSERVIDITIPPELISTNLPMLIEYARENRNQNGVFFDNEIDFRYVSRVSMEEQ